MTSKIIFTVDFDAFFVSCEEKLDPTLKNKPVVVGFELNGRGIVSTANYKARELGIKSGGPIYKARLKSKHLIVVEPKFEYYVETSEAIFKFLATYSSDIEVGSIDECHLDMTTAIKESGMDFVTLAKHIQTRIFKEYGIPASIGISNNKNLSKIASGLKKPMGITTLFKYEVEQKLWPLPIKELMFVGPATEKTFNDLGIFSIEQIAKLQTSQEIYHKLYKILGKRLDYYIYSALGEGSNQITAKEEDLKSIAKMETFPIDITNYEEAKDKLVEMVEYLCKRAEYRGLLAKGGGLSYQGKTSLHSYKSRQITFDKYSRDLNYVLGRILQLFDEWYNPNVPIRAFGVFLNKLKNEQKISNMKQMTLDDYWKTNEMDNEDLKFNKIKTLMNMVNFEIKSNSLMSADTLNTKKFKDKNLNTNDRVKFKTWGEYEKEK